MPLNFLTILSNSYKKLCPVNSPPWVSASIDPISQSFLGRNRMALVLAPTQA